jgi:hypothetical protein
MNEDVELIQQQCPDTPFSTELSEPQLRAARMIAMGEPYNDISSQLGIDRTTIYRWRKLPEFSTEVKRLVEAATLEGRKRVVRDVSEINDVILGTLLDVAQNDSSGGARVSAARALTELVERAEDRAQYAQHDVMRDQSVEIRGLLEDIRAEQNQSDQ